MGKKATIIKDIAPFAVLAVIVLFVSFVVFVKIKFSGKPKVYSDSEAKQFYDQRRKEIAAMIERDFEVSVPSNAKDLYSSSCGIIMGATSYAAFSLDSEDQCRTFFENEKMDFDNFKKGNLSLDGLWNRGLPNEWDEKYKDSNWKLSEGDVYLYGHGRSRGYVIYVPDESRIYMFWSVD